MKVFVSYTIRDGLVDESILESIEKIIKPISSVYIDLLHNSSKHPQLNVVKQLSKSSHIVLLITPKIYQSPWVRFELFVAKIFRKKIIKIEIEEVNDHNKYISLHEKVVK